MSTTEAVIKNVQIGEIDNLQSKYSYEESLLDKFSVEDDYKITVDNKTMDITEMGMQSFCKILGIPYKFGKKIPIDLLQHNVNRLKSPTRVRMVMRDNTLVNLMDSEYYPNFRVLNTSQLLEYFSGNNFDIKKIIVGDEGASIDIVHKDLGQVDLEPGNFISFGYRIQNPFTMFDSYLKSSLYADQKVCSNGMVLSRRLFGVNLDLRKDYGDEQDYFDRFKNSLDKKIGRSYNLDQLANIFDEANHTKVRGIMANKMISSIKNIDEPTCYKIFGFEEKEQEIESRKKFKENPLIETDQTFFNVMYQLTEECQKFGLRERLKAEQYSSTILDLCGQQKLYLN